MNKLTDEEIARIMVLRACNYSYREIEDEMGIGNKTIRKYLKQFEAEAEETSPEETVMANLSPLATVVIG